jgi:hypothetical protein
MGEERPGGHVPETTPPLRPRMANSTQAWPPGTGTTATSNTAIFPGREARSADFLAPEGRFVM